MKNTKDLIIKLFKEEKYSEVLELIYDNPDVIDKDILYYKGVALEDERDHLLEYNGVYEVYEEAAVLGSLEAQYRLAIYHRHEYFDYGEPEDSEMYVAYTTMSADSGYAPAQYELGYLFYMGRLVEENENLAIKYLELSAAQGYEESIKFLEEIKGDGSDAE